MTLSLARRPDLPRPWPRWPRLGPLAAALPLIAMAALGRSEPTAEPTTPQPEPYRLIATRSLDGAVTMRGAAPDRATRQRFLRAAGLAPPNEGGDSKTWTSGLVGIALRDDAPSDAGWTGRAHGALRAFALLAAGRLSVVDDAVVLEGRAESAAALDRIGALIEPDWHASVWVAPAPPQLTIEIGADGSLRSEGILPPGLETDDLAAVLPGIQISAAGTALTTLETVTAPEISQPLAPDIAPLPLRADRTALTGTAAVPFERQAIRLATPAAAQTWQSVIAALPIALPRIAEGTITLGPRRMALSGRLKRGFSAADTRAALRTALRLATGGAATETAPEVPGDDDLGRIEGGDNPPGPATLAASAAEDWQFRIDLADARPLARLTIGFADGRLSLAGILPEGLDPETALVRGGGAERAGLTSGGAGDPAQWRRLLDALAAVRDAIASAEGEATAERLVIGGQLQPGWSSADIETRLADALGAPDDDTAPPSLDLSLVEAPHSPIE